MNNSLKLYEISDEISNLLDNGIDEDGCISEELGAALAKFEDKGQAVAAYILNQEATGKAIDDAIDKLITRRSSLKNKSIKMREYLQDNMKRTGINSVQATDGTFNVKLYLERDASVEIFDEKQIPIEYLSKPEPPLPKPKKLDIKKALESGIDVPGARIVKNDRLEIKS